MATPRVLTISLGVILLSAVPAMAAPRLKISPSTLRWGTTATLTIEGVPAVRSGGDLGNQYSIFVKGPADTPVTTAFPYVRLNYTAFYAAGGTYRVKVGPDVFQYLIAAGQGAQRYKATLVLAKTHPKDVGRVRTVLARRLVTIVVPPAPTISTTLTSDATGVTTEVSGEISGFNPGVAFLLPQGELCGPSSSRTVPWAQARTFGNGPATYAIRPSQCYDERGGTQTFKMGVSGLRISQSVRQRPPFVRPHPLLMIGTTPAITTDVAPFS